MSATTATTTQRNAQDEALHARFQVFGLTREELKMQCKRDDFEMWGQPALTQEQYQEKEILQRNTPFSKAGTIFWAMVARPAPGVAVDEAAIIPGETPIVCHCESHRFDAMLRKRSGEIVHGFSHNIGSVFTLPAFRRQGLAAFFLRQIATELARLPQALGSTLYSDIGPTYYDRLGWRLYPSEVAVLDTKQSLPDSEASDNVLPPGVNGTLLQLDDAFDAFLAADNKRVRVEMESSKYDGLEAYAPLPTRASIEWQFGLGVLYARVRGFQTLPRHCGLKLRDDAFVVWCHNLKESTLYIVRARFPDDDPAATTTLLRAALAEARRFKLARVKVWAPTAALHATGVTQQLEITHTCRDSSLSSLMVFPQHLTGGTDGALPVWLLNEKFAWV
ncbi:TPA: hypothetical protein N0F65_002596 [Lagenidium giganteum]|uniref:LYC1 C-terminal domain-containing protein n=1 Tax=Lagenidium giganteum TaxID=4803 RepID=A0AAV2Z047_9STRA|nr:TPA: hypothetical protein N0F65_002596 [Lagenidium giganteum]